MKYTIFSVDNHTNLRKYARFLRYVSELEAMDKLSGNVIPCISSYEGKLEPSFLCLTKDYEEFFKNHTSLKEQECVMQISECNKRYAQLVYPDGSTFHLGCLKDVPAEEAKKKWEWTYRPDMDTYWIAVKGNPDHV